jgi:hypothetical protein
MKIVLEVKKTVLNIYFPNDGGSAQLNKKFLLYSVSYHGKAQAFVQSC